VGIDRRILVMAGIMPWECTALGEYSLTPVAHSLEELKTLNEHCAGGVRVHLKIDTGMNRLGTRARAAEIAAAAAAAPKLKIEGLMSHFASAADFTSEQTEDQIAMFREMQTLLATEGLRPPILHFASTNAVAYPRRDAWLSLVRTGHAIYGYVSPPRGHAPAPVLRVKPALQWKARIVLVKEVPAGARIGYGGTFVAQHAMRIAVLSAGYADGVPHRLSNRGKVIAGGKFAPIVGPVSMDLTTIDITGLRGLRPGDPVTLLGREGEVSLDAQQIARTAGTISYNVLCGISARVKRIYVD
jgi:alanine racemase